MKEHESPSGQISNQAFATKILETCEDLVELAVNPGELLSLTTEDLDKNQYLRVRFHSIALSEIAARLKNILPFQEQLTWTKAAAPDIEIFHKLAEQIFSCRWFSNFGSLHQELEAKLRDFLKVKHAMLVNNATIGLMLCLKYAQINPRSGHVKDYVITTPFTFPATAHAAKFCGLKVAFADIEPSSLCLDPAAVEAIIKKHGVPVAVMPVHVFGNVANMDAFQELRDRYGFWLIYDAAHCFGVEIAGKGIGSFGDFSVFSLHSTKVFHTGEGGVITFEDDSYLDLMSHLRAFGIRGNDTCFNLGINAKLSEINCAIGLALWPRLPDLLEARKKIFAAYLEYLGGTSGIKPVLQKDDTIKPNHAYATFTVAPELGIDRDRLAKNLSRFNIIARKYFYPLLSEVAVYKTDVDFFGANTPVAKRASNSCITLPLYPDLTEQDVFRICEILKFLVWASAITGSKESEI